MGIDHNKYYHNYYYSVPSSISDNPNNTETLRDTNVMLHCQAKGIPLPTIVWYKDSVGPVFDSVEVFSTTINETTVRSTIVFSNATWRDSGSYYCSAHNVLQSRGGNVTSANSTTALLVVYCKLITCNFFLDKITSIQL